MYCAMLDSGMAGILVVRFMLLKFVISLVFLNSFVVSDYAELAYNTNFY